MGGETKMSEEEYQNRETLKEFFEALFEYAKTSEEAMKKTSDLTFKIIKGDFKK